MKLLILTLGAALISGAAYGQQAGSLEWLEQRNIEQQIAEQREQLEEIQARQRQIRAQQSDQEYRWQQRERENQPRLYLEDCE